MTIAINTIHLNKKGQPTNDLFIQYYCSVALKNIADQFVFIVDETFKYDSTIPKNCVPINAKAPSNILSLELWQKYQLPKIVKKIQADILISINSLYTIQTTIPQHLFADDALLISRSKKNNLTAFNKAAKIITTSQALKAGIIEQYKIDEQKIATVYIAASTNYTPLSWEEKQESLKKIADGKEYFLHSGEIAGKENNLMILLKAFSLFKKWQKSNMQLIIATKEISFSKAFIESLKNYKYKEDVITVNNLSETELIKIYATAYCFVNPAEDKNYVSLLQSMQSKTPVIAPNNDINKEICNDAALYFDAGSFDHLSKKMILVYKDENKRNELIDKGIIQSEQYNYANTIAALTQLLHF